KVSCAMAYRAIAGIDSAAAPAPTTNRRGTLKSFFDAIPEASLTCFLTAPSHRPQLAVWHHTGMLHVKFALTSQNPDVRTLPMDAALSLRDPIAPQLVSVLRQSIAEMRMPPGMALSEKDIAARFGVSRQPVREAFIKLSEAGLVEIRP